MKFPIVRMATFAAAISACMLSISANAVEPSVSLGYNHGLVLRADGTVWSWGYDSSGQLGLGGGTRTAPTQIPTLENVVQVLARGSFSMALKADGTVWAWGDNSGGRTGGPGTSIPRQITTLANIVSINAGTHTAAAFATDAEGRVYAWGSNSYGQLGTGATSPGGNTVPRLVTGVPAAVAVSANDAGVLALAQDGGVHAWGYNASGALVPGVSLSPTAPVAVPNLSGMQAVGATAMNVAGQYYGLRGDGTVTVWGQALTSSSFCGQTVTGGGNSNIGLTTINGLSNIQQIEPGDGHTLFLDSNAKLFGCGNNQRGQLGDDTFVAPSTEQPKVVQVQGLPAVRSFAAGSGNSAAIGVDGSVWLWGKVENMYGTRIDNAATPLRVMAADGTPFDAGRPAEAPGMFAGTQSGALDNTTIDVGAAISTLHRGKKGRVYVAAAVGGVLFLMGPDGWKPYDGASITPYFAGTLPRLMSVRIGANLNLSGLTGVDVYVGYGVGEGAVADIEMLRSSRYKTVLTLR